MPQRRATRSSHPDTPAKQLSELARACAVLDDWLVWMEEVAPTADGSGRRARQLPYLVARPVLSLVGNCFEPEDVDGAIEAPVRYLMDVDSRVSDAVFQWRCELTGGAECVVEVSLMSWTPLEGTQATNPWDWASQHVPPFPTAHEATLAWWLKLRRLVEAQCGAESTSQSQTDPRPPGRYSELFAQLTWNTAAALELLAGMEQERRWLHNHFAGTVDDARRPFPTYDQWILVNNRLPSELDALLQSLKDTQELQVIQALRRCQPQTGDELHLTVTGREGRMAGALSRAVTSLMDLGLIAGSRGRTSLGYRLTIAGVQIAVLHEQKRPSSGNIGEHISQLKAEC
ncbi:MAG: hypothetical protein SH850_09485 [Planctomycetaceae bacterium]|nr:hypothetical protein [Planctomycetaceae bacterium]